MAGADPLQDGIEDQFSSQRQAQGGEGQAVTRHIQGECLRVRVAGPQLAQGVIHPLRRYHHAEGFPGAKDQVLQYVTIMIWVWTV